MFDIGWTELLVIGIVALIVIGPRELPKTLRTIGQMMTKVRRMASEFQGQFNEAIREAELDELRKEAEKLSGITDPLGNFDPLSQVKSEIESAVEGKPKSEPAATIEPAADSGLEQIESANAPNETATETPASGGGRAA
jgi:sec-independent protein translocase protein TatB